MKDDSDRLSAVSLERKVAFLSAPENYAERPREMHIRETHMSWVFLAGDHVYKLKKPARYPFLDFSTVNLRRESCVREIELNQALAGDVYLEAVPLTFDEKGTLGIDGEGEAVDWLVRMRRLPHDKMLDHAIRHGGVEEEAIRNVAELLGRFYCEAKPVAMSAAEYVARLERGIREDLAELIKPSFELPAAEASEVAEAQLRFLSESAALFERRVAEGKIVDGHGDLRPEHVCLGPEPCVIDRLEFNPEFRILDPLEELSFLAMESELLGSELVGEIVFESYRRRSGDVFPERLAAFFKSKRALLRSKLMIAHTRESQYRGAPEWRRRALEYLRCGKRYAGVLG